jgi:hypothetical protein
VPSRLQHEARRKRLEKWRNGRILHFCDAWNAWLWRCSGSLVEKPNALLVQPRIWQTLHPVTFCRSLTKNEVLKSPFPVSWNTVQQPACAPYSRSFQECLQRGKTSRARVCLQKRCTWKAFSWETTAVEIFMFYRWLPGTLWYSHIHKLTVHWT